MQRLIKNGHRREDIATYPLDIFMMTLHAIDQIEAAARVAFVSDITAVVSGMYADPKAKGPSPLTTHLEVLTDVIKGATQNGSES